MTPREIALRDIEVGDIFHAESSSGGSLICRAVSVTGKILRARAVTTQLYYDFDRRSGVAIWKGEGVPEWNGDEVVCTIDSIARLPNDILKAIEGLDQKFGDCHREPEYYILSKDERRALVFVSKFYSLHPV